MKVGDTVVFYGDRTRSLNTLSGAAPGCECVITAVGRKWITATYQHREFRFQKEAPHYVDAGGYSTPGRIYASVAEYEATTGLENAWHALRTEMHRTYAMPRGFTHAHLQTIRTLLNLGSETPA